MDYAQLYYRLLDNEKTEALEVSKDHFTEMVTLGGHAKSDLQWWIDDVQASFKRISHRNPQMVLQSDGSKFG